MTLKRILREAPKEAQDLFYDGEGNVSFFGNGTSRWKDKIGDGYLYTPKANVSEKRWIAGKLQTGKWVVYNDKHLSAVKKLKELGYVWNSEEWAKFPEDAE